MPMIRRFLVDEKGLSRLTWVLLAAIVAVGTVMYYSQLKLVLSDLRQFGAWIGSGGFL